MTMSFFDQFIIPQIMGIPLVIIAMALPLLLLFTPPNQPTNTRTSALQLWTFKTLSKQLMMPINTHGQKWAALLLTLAFFLLLINLSGLLPYTFTPTTQLSMNMSLAIPMWLATVLTGLRNQPTTSLGHLLPEGTPHLLIPILIVIETISLFIRPIALGVRLTANLTAGHLLLQLISTTIFITAFTLPTAALTALTVLTLLTALELAVAMIQAYVFVLLLSLYLQENV